MLYSNPGARPMAETLTIVCDRCGERTAKAFRTRVKWGAQPIKRASVDLCGECTEWLLTKLGRIAPPLPFGDDAEALATPAASAT
jgi:hypothetical protein